MRSGDMLAHCEGPVWQVDDISNCVQRNFLKVLFPLIAIGISSLVLFSQSIRRSVRLKRASKYSPLANGHHVEQNGHGNGNGHHNDFAPEEAEDEDDQVLTMGGGRLALAKTTTKGSVAEIDSPRGQYTMLVLELLAILAVLSINVAAFILHAYGSKGTLATTVGIATWSYIAVLASFRLLLSKTKWRIPGVWNHTAALYTALWLFSLVIFRSAIVHPRSGIAQALLISEFFLTTFLFAIAITTRKGNKAVVLEWEDGIEPSREPLASLFSLGTFSWADAILWRGYKKTLELPDVWNLLPKDKAAAVLADYRQLRKTTALTLHLARYFKGLLIIQCSYAVFEGAFTFAPTLILKAILEYIEDPESTPRNVVWLYVILLAFTDVLRSLASGQALWIGRKINIRLRAIMVGEIFAKSLRRKAASGNETVLGDKKDQEDAAKPGFFKRIFGGKKKDEKKTADASSNSEEPAQTKGSDEQVNTGTIINLMSVDSFKVSEITAYLHFLLAAAPTQLVVAIYLLYRILGLSSIPGLVVMVILLPVNIAFARGFGAFQKKIMAATDKRIHITNEVLQNIRIIKYFAWEHRFSIAVNEKRAVELKALKSKYILWAFAVAVWNTVPVVITFFSFLTYTVVEKKPLYPSIAFTAISLFNILRVPLDQLGDMIAHVLESKVSVDRVEEFLNEEETEKYEQLNHDCLDEDGNPMIGFTDATFSWGGKESPTDEISESFRLIKLNIKFEVGKLNIIAGPTGSGKTSLLMALMGEMTCIGGKVSLPGGGKSREDIYPDPDTGLAESIAYCAQQAWLVNADIKENILFAQPLDEKRYKDVIVACALERDLEILDAGDRTLVGEKGVTLSGGQKQRISLARALYSNSRHLLLDDCLSAVDSHTAKWIFDMCIRGPLMQGRTCILVTHNLALCVPQFRYIVLLDNGKIEIQGPADEVMASGKLGDEVNKSRPTSAAASRIPSRVPSSVGDENNENLIESTQPGEDATTLKKIKSSQNQAKKDAMEETKEEGGVKWSVLALYLKAMGPWWFWVLAVLVFGVQQVGSLAANIWIREWANQYNTESVTAYHILPPSSLVGNTIATIKAASSRVTHLQPYFDPNKTSILAKVAPGVDVGYYLAVYAMIGVACMLVALFRDFWLFFGSITASWELHKRLMHSVTRAKFKFFDATPLGQLMNRFSKDIEAVDQEVAPVAIGVMSCGLAIIVTVALISAITPGFLIAGFFIGLLYFAVGSFYLRSSRDLKRLESVQRSPLFQQFGETLNGITTIRAYGDERRFIRDNMSRINNHSRPFIYLWAANRWLAFRMDIVGDLIAFFAGAFIVVNIGKIDAGAAGLSLSYAISFTENVLWLVRLYAINEQNMNSVERIKEYLDVEQEAEAVIEKTRPAANWPSQGSVEFINYTTRYRSDLDPVLQNVSFKIQPFEKVGIVGRTGAGKSSLALALFRGLEADDGKILIDDVDIGLIGLQDLRESITIVPQDPTLFTGTIRTNLDPFNLFTDEDIFTALRRVQLIGVPTSATIPSTPVTLDSPVITLGEALEIPAPDSGASTPVTNKNVFLNLSSPVTESGNNLSQGQRQLLCLARALLKQPRVLMMDEATASIDYNTDSKIQETIRELNSTIITIAHRLQTIVDYDKVLVLDKGRVVEYGHPHELLKKDGTDAVFRGMCEMSGDLDLLQKAAKKAFEAKRLVDDE